MFLVSALLLLRINTIRVIVRLNIPFMSFRFEGFFFYYYLLFSFVRRTMHHEWMKEDGGRENSMNGRNKIKVVDEDNAFQVGNDLFAFVAGYSSIAGV